MQLYGYVYESGDSLGWCAKVCGGSDTRIGTGKCPNALGEVKVCFFAHQK